MLWVRERADRIMRESSGSRWGCIQHLPVSTFSCCSCSIYRTRNQLHHSWAMINWCIATLISHLILFLNYAMNLTMHNNFRFTVTANIHYKEGGFPAITKDQNSFLRQRKCHTLSVFVWNGRYIWMRCVCVAEIRSICFSYRYHHSTLKS